MPCRRSGPSPSGARWRRKQGRAEARKRGSAKILIHERYSINTLSLRRVGPSPSGARAPRETPRSSDETPSEAPRAVSARRRRIPRGKPATGSPPRNSAAEPPRDSATEAPRLNLRETPRPNLRETPRRAQVHVANLERSLGRPARPASARPALLLRPAAATGWARAGGARGVCVCVCVLG